MPSLLVIVAIVGILLFLLNLAVQAGLLLLVCRLLRLREVTYWRALLATIIAMLVAGLATYPLAMVAEKLADDDPILLAFYKLGALGLSVLISIGMIPVVLRVSPMRGLLAALGQLVLSISYGVAFVFLLRATVAEAFMMPTGAMAPALLGYHKDVACPHCGFAFEVNASAEAEGPPEFRHRDENCVCPNCRSEVNLVAPALPLKSGDRMLTFRRGFDSLVRLKSSPQRLDLVVFRYPKGVPKETQSEPLIFVKRLVGLPGETIAIHGGDVYVSDDVPEAKDVPEDGDIPQSNPAALKLFNEGKFRIIRKPPELVLGMRRIVYDHDHPRRKAATPRWDAEGGWTADAQRFSHAADGAESWLTYRHRVGEEGQSQLVTTFEGYNSAHTGFHRGDAENWIGDLLLECEVTVDRSEGQFLLELGRGVDRFQARWDLAGGDCTLLRKSADAEEELGTQKTTVRQPGSYRLRLANVDQRLTVWVGDALPFGDGVAYDPAPRRGPTEQDLAPARVGARKAAVRVDHLQLWRDVYYGSQPGRSDVEMGDWTSHSPAWGDPDAWTPWQSLPVKTYTVKPGHYFVLGDNSSNSSDSRMWGLVPDRLLSARAALVYYPFDRLRELR